jgi:hypothetical protein
MVPQTSFAPGLPAADQGNSRSSSAPMVLT